MMQQTELNLPNLLVIGGQKCGSTWIHRKLSLHNKCFMSKVKELTFFLKKEELHDITEYASNFQIDKSLYQYYGESTPVYLWTCDEKASYCKYSYGNKNIAASIRKTLGPELKIVISLRNPVDRALSAYLHHFKNGRFRGNESILDVGDQYGIIDMGFYKRHLAHWFKYYPIENFSFVFFDDIKKDPHATLFNLLTELNLENDFSRLPNVNRQNNPGFTLKVVNDCITIDMESLKKLNENAFIKNIANLHKDYIVPLIHINEFKKLNEIFYEDNKFIMDLFDRHDLRWNDEIKLTSLLNN